MPKNWAVRGSESGPIGGEGKEDEKHKKKKDTGKTWWRLSEHSNNKLN